MTLPALIRQSGAPAEQRLELVKGDDQEVVVTVTSNAAAYALTGVTAASLHFYDLTGDVQLSGSPISATSIDAANGLIYFDVSAAVSGGLPVPASADPTDTNRSPIVGLWAVRVTDGTKSRTIAAGDILLFLWKD